eukprot:156835-Chlamydomonas_euryale.AAC.1
MDLLLPRATGTIGMASPTHLLRSPGGGGGGACSLSAEFVPTSPGADLRYPLDLRKTALLRNMMMRTDEANGGGGAAAGGVEVGGGNGIDDDMEAVAALTTVNARTTSTRAANNSTTAWAHGRAGGCAESGGSTHGHATSDAGDVLWGEPGPQDCVLVAPPTAAVLPAAGPLPWLGGRTTAAGAAHGIDTRPMVLDMDTSGESHDGGAHAPEELARLHATEHGGGDRSVAVPASVAPPTWVALRRTSSSGDSRLSRASCAQQQQQQQQQEQQEQQQQQQQQNQQHQQQQQQHASGGHICSANAQVPTALRASLSPMHAASAVAGGGLSGPGPPPARALPPGAAPPTLLATRGAACAAGSVDGRTVSLDARTVPAATGQLAGPMPAPEPLDRAAAAAAAAAALPVLQHAGASGAAAGGGLGGLPSLPPGRGLQPGSQGTCLPPTERLGGSTSHRLDGGAPGG